MVQTGQHQQATLPGMEQVLGVDLFEQQRLQCADIDITVNGRDLFRG